MSLKIVHDEDRTLALFAKDDSIIGFHCQTTRADRLPTSVFKAMFGTDYDAQHAEEVNKLVRQLLAEGYVSFEDGWLELRTGLDDVVSFYTEKLQQACEERNEHDQDRYSELKRREAAEASHKQLCDALVKALGPAGAAEVRGKIAYATAGAPS